MGSTVQITYDDAGTPLDITADVLFEDAQFESQMNAVAGTFSFRVKDADQSYDFVTGREIRLYIDGIPMFGGYIRRVGMTYPFPADDTTSPQTYEKRIWRLEGVDYNVLFDTRYIRNTSNYLGHIPDSTGYAWDTMDGWVLRKLLTDYCDFPTGFDISSEIDDITTVFYEDEYLEDTQLHFQYKQQGTKIREQFDERAAKAGAVFYIGPDKIVHYHAYETVQKRWGFSDNPNYTAITTSPNEYQGATWGFREVSGTEDGTLIVNDALIWGGGAPATDTTTFARIQDDTDSYTYVYGKSWIDDGNLVAGSSIDLHGRWQLSETHFNEMKVLSAVKARANVIINGPPGASVEGQQKGLRYPQWLFDFTWFASTVPELDGTPDHIIAGDIVNIDLDAFGVSEMMPCRTLRINFPALEADGTAHVQFNGQFSLQYTDPIALWKTILDYEPQETPATVGTVDANSSESDYGDTATGQPVVEAPDGSRTVFHTTFPYVAYTLEIFINGLRQTRGTDYVESDPAEAEFTLSTAPVVTDTVTYNCKTLEAASGVRPWDLPVTTATYNVPSLGSGDVTSALNAYIDTVPDGSIVNLGTATYHISGCIDLRGRNNLIFQGTSDGSRATIISTAAGEPSYDSCFSTQTNGFEGASTSHITIRYINFTGGNATPGHMSSSGEHNHFLQISGGSYYEIGNCTLQGMHGDIAAIRDAGSYLWVHDNVVPDCGRNFVSVIWGSHVLVERNTLGLAGWSIFDIEPNPGSSDGSTMTDIIFRNNTAENWSSATGFFFGNSSGVSSSANVDNVVIANNTITQRSLFSIIGFNTLGRRRYLTFTNNVGGVATPVYQAMPGMISLKASDHAVITGNVQPRVSGDTKPLVYAYAGCTDVISQ